MRCLKIGAIIYLLGDRIEAIRNTILENADQRGWTIDEAQLDDRHIIRRMVLKKCLYGVDKNSMAVELAKVALWLHTFTVGAPLSFLDHHLRCGDSLFGSWVKAGVEKARALGSPLLLHEPIERALGSATNMRLIEGLTDAEIAEAHRSADVFKQIKRETAPLDSLLSLIHALDWLKITDRSDRLAVRVFFSGQLGDPLAIAMGAAEPDIRSESGKRFVSILAACRELMAEERFHNWQVAFPGVWANWEEDGLTGFDAVVGNPPWDRVKLQQVEWFAERRREIAMAPRAADRKRMIEKLEQAGDPLAIDYAKASGRAESAARMARTSGDYPLLSGGDINLYSLFVERAMAIVKRDGLVGLLVPSGIASDKTAAKFFKGVSTEGRLLALYDFENRRNKIGLKPFFEDVDGRFKFCAFVASPSETPKPAKCAFFLQSVTQLKDPDVCFSMRAEDFARVNPNTGTAPVFKSRRDAELTTRLYKNASILTDLSGDQPVKAWPVRYATMFHMTNDSKFFRTEDELINKEGAYPVGGNIYDSKSGKWVPLYEGKMVQAYDHRAASIVVNEANQHRPAQPVPANEDQHSDPEWIPDPQYWVSQSKCGLSDGRGWVLGFKEITAPTNMRTVIASILPDFGFGNKIPLLLPEDDEREEWLLCANLNSIPLDYVARQKIQGQTLNKFIVEQLPVIPVQRFKDTFFGEKTAFEVLREAVLELTYVSNDMDAFARDIGYVGQDGEVLAPYAWNGQRRVELCAKIDAIFFVLYGITDREEVRYIYSTFPIVERVERAEYDGVYRSRELCLAYLNALAAGDPDAEIKM